MLYNLVGILDHTIFVWRHFHSERLSCPVPTSKLIKVLRKIITKKINEIEDCLELAQTPSVNRC